MSNDTDREWVSKRYSESSLGSDGIEGTIARLNEALQAQVNGEWKDLCLDYECDSDGWGNGSDRERLFIVGRRLETDIERDARKSNEQKNEDFQRRQYEALKAKFEPQGG